MSEKMAISYASLIKKKSVIISIVSKGENSVIFPNNNNIVDIFRLYINDLDKDVDGHKAPIQQDFDGLKEFIDKYKDCDFIIHCGAGVSRSPAVAIAIGEYLGQDTREIQERSIPNRLVYRLVMYELTRYVIGSAFLANDSDESIEL